MRHLRPQVPVPPARLVRSAGVAMVPVGDAAFPAAPSQPAALFPEGGITVQLPGYNYPPPGSTPVDEIGDANLAPGATGTLVTIVVPDTLRFRATGIGFGADDEVALSNLTWSIRLNGDTAPGYEVVPAAVGSIRQLSRLEIFAGSSVTFTVFATIAATAVLTYRYIARVQGYFYAEKEYR